MSYFQFRKLEPISRKNKQIGRSVCIVGGRSLVLFHKNGQALGPQASHQLRRMMRNLNLGPVTELSSNRWTWCQAPPENFNCHALAIGSSVGLTPEDWLEGQASQATLRNNPVQLLLNEYFVPVAGGCVDNDIFVLGDSKTQHLIHSGFIRWIDNQPVAISKFGEGPILMTGLELIANVFRHRFDQISWYRKRSTAGRSALQLAN